VNRTPEERRHIAVHTGHCVELNEADRAAWDSGGHELLEPSTLSGTADQVRRKLDDLADRGVTEIVFQPCGPDVRRELERFLDVASRSAAAVHG
jgi:5,10-methylenetetrahydromethanopterin reductase